MHKEGYYSSGEFAKKANVTVRTIRYYDKQNILKPSLLTEDGVRFYTDSDFTRLQQILLFKYLGFSLEDRILPPRVMSALSAKIPFANPFSDETVMLPMMFSF